MPNILTGPPYPKHMIDARDVLTMNLKVEVPSRRSRVLYRRCSAPLWKSCPIPSTAAGQLPKCHAPRQTQVYQWPKRSMSCQWQTHWNAIERGRQHQTP
jgi:hypothetical protein